MGQRDAAGHGFGRRVRAVGHKDTGSSARDNSLGGRGCVGTGAAGEDLGLEAVEVETAATGGDQRLQPLGLAGAGGYDAQVGARQAAVAGDGVQQILRQVAVEDDGAGPVERVQRRQNRGAGLLKAVRIGDGRDQPLAVLDAHIAVGRQTRVARQAIGQHAKAIGLGHQGLALGVAADC